MAVEGTLHSLTFPIPVNLSSILLYTLADLTLVHTVTCSICLFTYPLPPFLLLFFCLPFSESVYISSHIYYRNVGMVINRHEDCIRPILEKSFFNALRFFYCCQLCNLTTRFANILHCLNDVKERASQRNCNTVAKFGNFFK